MNSIASDPEAGRKTHGHRKLWVAGVVLLVAAVALVILISSTNKKPRFPARPEVGSTWVRPADGMVMVFVPEGDFQIGSAENEDEGPIHQVHLEGFWIDRTEVTKDMYDRCVQAGGCQSTGQENPDVESKAGDTPVLYTTWADAVAYCSWAGARLPTEAEWERAARGSDNRTYPWGEAAPDCSLANFFDLTGACNGEVLPVGSLPGGASPYGALDMAGNVWEWVNDWYAAGYYLESPGNDPQGPDSGIYRVMRGGSWATTAAKLRTSDRNREEATGRHNDIGFRCADGD